MNRFALLFLFLSAFSYASDDPEADQYFTLIGDFAASHILISHKGADAADPKIKRSREEALARANQVVAELAKDPLKFSDLARAYSDGPSAVNGGDLGTFNKGEMAGRFEAALKKLEVGDYTKEPVKTQFGYHIIKRNPLRVKNYAVRGLFITYKGAFRVAGMRDDIDILSEEDAKTTIEGLAAQITPENFPELAEKHSHIAQKFGFLGVVRKGQSPIFNQIIAELEQMNYGEVSRVVQLPIGFAVLQRIKVEKLGGRQILISHLDAINSPDDELRTRKEAKAFALKLIKQLEKNPKKFAAMAKKHSSDRYRVNGGLLPRWYIGYRAPQFDKAVSELGPGEITAEPIETDEGFFVVMREDPNADKKKK